METTKTVIQQLDNVEQMFSIMSFLLMYSLPVVFWAIHHHGRYIQTQFRNFNLAKINVNKELSSFPFMNMFIPTDMLIDNFTVV